MTRNLTVKLIEDEFIEIDYDPATPPHVFFDTSVLLGMGSQDIARLRQLQAERAFRYRYSMLNFVELASHLADDPGAFQRYRAAFRRILDLCDPEPLPSVEMVLMNATGLEQYLHDPWAVDPANIYRQVQIIAAADSIEDLQKAGVDPGHYKKLRQIDGQSFVSILAQGKALGKPVKVTNESATWLGRLYSFMLFRASGKRMRLELLSPDAQLRFITFFHDLGGQMFEGHLLKVLLRTVNDGRADDANDFYDMMQLILLHDPNLLFVADDRMFFSYYMGADHHRVVPWKGFKVSGAEQR